MKKIFLLTILLLSSLSQAADFTITIQGNNGGSFAKKLKGDNQIIGDLFLAGFQENYVIINGKKWGFNPSAGSVDSSGKGDFLATASFPCFFESNNCSGDCLVSPFDGTKTALTNMIISVVPVNGSGYNGLLEITSNKTSGQLTLNSCKEPYDGYCSTDPSYCGGANSISENGVLKPGVELKRAILHNRSTYIGKPTHDFKFKSIEYE